MQQATKDKNLEKVGALRLLLSALSYLEKTGKEFGENEELTVLKTEAKKRREAIEAYEKAGRPERVEQERNELTVIEEYLPQQASEEEIKTVVLRLQAEMGGGLNKGQLIGKVMAEIGRDKTDGTVVSKVVNEIIK